MPGRPAAKMGDKVVGVDIHIILVPAAAGAPVPTPGPHPFNGTITENCVPTVKVMGMPVATVGSIARNVPPHLPIPPAGSFSVPPTNMGTIRIGSPTVKAAGKPIAHVGDPVETCNDPMPAPTSAIVGASTVMVA